MRIDWRRSGADLITRFGEAGALITDTNQVEAGGAECALSIGSSIAIHRTVSGDYCTANSIVLRGAGGEYATIAASVWPMTEARASAETADAVVSANGRCKHRNPTRGSGRAGQVENRPTCSVA